MTRNVYATPTPQLEEQMDYPLMAWEEQRLKYWKYWRHFDGDWLDDTTSDTDQTLKFPLKLNPFNMACMLHAGFLFGEVSDGTDPLTTAVVEPWNRDSGAQAKEDATKLTDTINRVWYENGGRGIQQEAGVVSQVCGGCVYGVKYDPQLERRGRLPIRIDHLMPEYFFPVPSPFEYWDLLECFVAFMINGTQAHDLYKVTPSADNVLYQEHWTQKRYDISVDGAAAKWGDIPLRGKPIGEYVPYVYIPHMRSGQFYGTSLLANRRDLAEEINERFADVGDIVSENARLLPAVVGSPKISVRRLSYGVTVLDINAGVPGQNPPTIIYPSGNQVNSATVDWAKELLNLARTGVYTPPVCYGMDEGSQRSALTLALRLIPLVVHIRQERTYWTTGLNQIDRMILAIAAKQGINGVKPSQIQDIRIWQEWAPVLPRDREALVNEMILRLNSYLIDPTTAMEKMGDIRDLTGTMNLIKKWIEYKAEMGLIGGSNPFGGAGSMGEQSGQQRPSVSQPNLNKEE